MILGSTPPIDIISHIKGLYDKLQSFQITYSEESKKLFENKLKGLTEPSLESSTDKKQTAYYLRKLALAHFQTVNYKEAEYYTELLFNTCPYSKPADTDIYTSEILLNSIKEAYEYNRNIYKIVSELTNQDLTAISYNNLGNIFLIKNNFEEALSYFKRALAVLTNKNLNRLRSTVHRNISIIQLQFKNYSEALNHSEKSIELSKMFDDLQSIAFCTFLTGKIHFENKDLENALKYFQSAVKILAHLENKNGSIVSNILLAKTFLQLSSSQNSKTKIKFKEIKEYVKTAMNIAKDAEDKSTLLFVYKNAAEIYEEKGNFEKANKYRKKYNETELNVIRENFSVGTKELSDDFENRKRKFIAELQDIYNKELAQAADILKSKDKVKDDFVGDVVHDLKNPIGNIKQLVEYLTGGTDLTEEDRSDFLQLILESADASLSMITKLLDNTAVRHAEEINLNPEDFDITELINKIIKFYTIQTINKSINIKVESHPINNIIRTDKEILNHVLDNLISNAIKFSPKGKNIYINLSEENNYLKIEVKDEGPGFSAEDREKLFKQFSKLSARPTAGEHSSGLGLSIVKKLTDALNGTIECVSEKGKGANMILRIPIQLAISN